MIKSLATLKRIVRFPVSNVFQKYFRSVSTTSDNFLPYENDRFQGITIKAEKIDIEVDEFQSQLAHTITNLKNEKRHIWFEVPTQKVHYIQSLIAQGFEIHSARRGDRILLSKVRVF